MSESQKIAPLATNFVVDHTVPAANRDEFLALEKSLEDAVREASGCLSVKLEEVPSDQPDELHYRTTMGFDSQDSLVAWVDSDRRHDLVHQARESFHYGYALKSRVRGFDAWFPPPKGPEAAPPAAWKMNLLVLTTLYPTVLALGPVLRPLTKNLDFPTSMLLGNLCSVSITGWILIPLANKLYGPWIHPPLSARAQVWGPLSAIAILGLAWLVNHM